MGIVNNLVSKVAKQDDGSGACKCTILNEKMNALWLTLKEEARMCAEQEVSGFCIPKEEARMCAEQEVSGFCISMLIHVDNDFRSRVPSSLDLPVPYD